MNEDLIDGEEELDQVFLDWLYMTRPDTMADWWAEFCESHGLDPEDPIGVLWLVG